MASPISSVRATDRDVPIGGTLTEAPNGGPLNSMIHSLRDLDGAILDRAQFIKECLDGDDNGEPHERIYCAAASFFGRLPSVVCSKLSTPPCKAPPTVIGSIADC